MNNNELQIAKEIFLNHEGSHYLMDRENEYEKYKSFQITPEQEKIWIREYQITLIQNMGTEITSRLVRQFCFTAKLFQELSNWNEMISKLKKIEPSLDTFSRLRIAEEIIETVQNISLKNACNSMQAILNDSKSFAFGVLKDLLQKPITVGSIYDKFRRFDPKDHDPYSSEAITKRIKDLLNEYDN